jgi:hypothetical protein
MGTFKMRNVNSNFLLSEDSLTALAFVQPSAEELNVSFCI